MESVVFSNIASSEQMHMNALLKLLKKYDLPDPAAGNEIRRVHPTQRCKRSILS